MRRKSKDASVEKLRPKDRGISAEKAKFQDKEAEMDSIRKEVADLIKKEEELKKKNESNNPGLSVVDPELLTEDDLKMYREYRDNTWQYEAYLEYTNHVTEQLRELGEEAKGKSKDEVSRASTSRDNFRDFLAKQASLRFPGEETEEERQKDN